MTGTLATYTNGHPWPGGESISFEREVVRAVGQLTAYNDFVTRYLVRLVDGREAFVVIRDQPDADQKWFKAICRQINRDQREKAIAGTLVVPTKEISCVLTWRELP
jgi:DNA-binding cell septation regulator SpoVG